MRLRFEIFESKFGLRSQFCSNCISTPPGDTEPGLGFGAGGRGLRAGGRRPEAGGWEPEAGSGGKAGGWGPEAGGGAG